MRSELPLVAGLCLLLLGVYVSTLAPGLVFADAGELALVAATDGVAHPPGFPLYLLLAKLWLAMPGGGDVAWRLNLLSAVFGALTFSGIYLCVRLITGGTSAGWIQRVAPAGAASIFTFSYTFWRQATITEVYTLNLLLASLVLLLAVRYHAQAAREAPSARDAGAIGLVAGLGLANHLSLGLMLFGVAALVIIAPRPNPRTLLRDVAVGLGCFGLGLLLYASLPLRAAAEPLFAWGDPRDLASLWRHASGWQYQLNFRPGAATAAKQLAVFGETAVREVGWLPLLLLLPLGLVRLARRHRALLVAFAIAFLVPFVYVLGYDIAEDQSTYFLIPFLIAALVMGVGIDALLRHPRARGREGWLAGALLLVALSPLPLNYARADRSLETEARDYALDVLEGVREDAIVLTRFWNLYAPVLYLQHLEALRRDVDFVDLALLQYTWYLDYLAREQPSLFSGLGAQLVRYRELHARWEYASDALTLEERAEAETLFGALIEGIVREGWRRGRPVYATFETVVEVEEHLRRDPEQAFLAVPEALPMRLLPQRHPYHHPLPEVTFRNRWERHSRDEVAGFVRNRYVEFWLQRGRYFESRGRWRDASQAYRQAQAIPPGSEAALQGLQRVEPRGPREPSSMATP